MSVSQQAAEPEDAGQETHSAGLSKAALKRAKKKAAAAAAAAAGGEDGGGDATNGDAPPTPEASPEPAGDEGADSGDEEEVEGGEPGAEGAAKKKKKKKCEWGCWRCALPTVLPPSLCVGAWAEHSPRCPCTGCGLHRVLFKAPIHLLALVPQPRRRSRGPAVAPTARRPRSRRYRPPCRSRSFSAMASSLRGSGSRTRTSERQQGMPRLSLRCLHPVCLPLTATATASAAAHPCCLGCIQLTSCFCANVVLMWPPHGCVAWPASRCSQRWRETDAEKRELYRLQHDMINEVRRGAGGKRACGWGGV